MRARALAVLEQHVRSIAEQCDQTPEFVCSELNYRSLEPAVEAAMAEDAGRICCGHPFANELDIEIAYREPARDHQDYVPPSPPFPAPHRAKPPAQAP